MKKSVILITCCLALFMLGCEARKHAADTQSGLQGDKLTVGVVQKEIRKGMSGANDVATLFNEIMSLFVPNCDDELMSSIMRPYVKSMTL